MMKNILILGMQVILLPFIWGQSEGPENGSCFIIGGGRLDSSIINTFIREAGGPEAFIVIIPTAISDQVGANDPNFMEFRKRYDRMGFKNFEVLHSTDPKVINSKEFIGTLDRASGLWFTGGRQWRLVDAYGETEALPAFRRLLQRGGIIAGSSAGATIQGSFLARGDTQTNTIMMGDHQEGFGFVSGVAIDQHVLARNRQFDLFEIMEAHPDVLGIGLDENTGLLIKGNQAEVVGQSYVLIYDGTRWDATSSSYIEAKSHQTFHLLSDGDQYDINLRKRISNN